MFAKEDFNLREREPGKHEFVPFSVATWMSGINMNGSVIRKGAAREMQ